MLTATTEFLYTWDTEEDDDDANKEKGPFLKDSVQLLCSEDLQRKRERERQHDGNSIKMATYSINTVTELNTYPLIHFLEGSNIYRANLDRLKLEQTPFHLNAEGKDINF